jgi:hypothetical protein
MVGNRAIVLRTLVDSNADGRHRIVLGRQSSDVKIVRETQRP